MMEKKAGKKVNGKGKNQRVNWQGVSGLLECDGFGAKAFQSSELKYSDLKLWA